MKFILPIFLSGFLFSCSTIAPKIYSSTDPFTKVYTRAMVVDISQSQQFLDALFTPSSYSTLYSPQRPASLPLNHFMTLSVSGSDTLLNLIRFVPDRGYDVPSNARLQIKLIPNDENGPIYELPLVEPYHTTGGPLIVRARVNGQVARALQSAPLDVVRVSQVSTNESNFLPVDWSPNLVYARAFQQGTSLLLTSKPGRAAKAAQPAKQKKPFKWGWQK